MTGRPPDSLLSGDSSFEDLPSKRREPNDDMCITENEGTSMSGSFENLSAPNKLAPTASSENLWIFPLVGHRPRLDGAKHYDLVCERDPLLPTYGFLSQALWIIEEQLFNDPELNDEQKAMNALWTRWLALYRYSICFFSWLLMSEGSRLKVFRVDFIENARLCCINFVEHKYDIIYHAAGWHAFRSWILVSRADSFPRPFNNTSTTLGPQIQQLPHAT